MERFEGTIVKVKPEHEEHLTRHMESCHALEALIRRTNREIIAKEEELWELLNKLYPETKGYHSIMSFKRMEILIMTKEKEDKND